MVSQVVNNETPKDINLYHLLKFYASKWMTILVLTVFGVVLGFVYNNYIQTPLYKSNATLLLVNPADKTATQNITSINNYVELFKSRRVLESVIQEKHLDMSYDNLINSVDVTNDKDTEVIKVAITTKDPFVSKSLVEGSVVSFKNQVKQLYDMDNVQIVDGASFDTAPSNVNTVMTLAISAAAGFIVSIIILFFIYDYDLNRKEEKKVVAKKEKIAKPSRIKKVVSALRAKAKILQAKRADIQSKRVASKKAKAKATRVKNKTDRKTGRKTTSKK